MNRNEQVMKVFVVVGMYYAGHEHGYYQSPFFARREDAEAFLAALGREASSTGNGRKAWWSPIGVALDGEREADIEEIDVLPQWDGELKDSDEYLHITWT